MSEQPFDGAVVTQPTDPNIAALQQVLAAHHAAVYGYPLVGVKLADPAGVQRARSLEAAHRLTRDAISTQLVALAAIPVAAEPEYAPATPVTDAASARQWAVQLEERCAAAYRYLLAATTQASGSAAGAGSPVTLRQQAATGLTTSAVDATGWRRLIAPAKPTVAFPGL